MKLYNMTEFILTLKSGALVYNCFDKQKAIFSHIVTPAFCQSKIMVYLKGRKEGLDLSHIEPYLKDKKNVTISVVSLPRNNNFDIKYPSFTKLKI